VSLIFYVDGADKGVDPFGKERMGSPEEQLYYRYTLARLSAFPNLMWDLANRTGQMLRRLPGQQRWAKVTLAAGRYHAKWFNPRTGAWLKLPDANQAVDGVWTSPAAADAGDWALLLQAK
jgi:hypothetical protein